MGTLIFSPSEDKFERRGDRVIFGNELGDWRETSYDNDSVTPYPL